MWIESCFCISNNDFFSLIITTIQLMRPRDKERCCSGSILMKDSDIIIYIMKILWRGLEIYRKAVELEVKFRIKLHLQEVRKHVGFTDHKKENTLKFPRSKIWY